MLISKHLLQETFGSPKTDEDYTSRSNFHYASRQVTKMQGKLTGRTSCPKVYRVRYAVKFSALKIFSICGSSLINL